MAGAWKVVSNLSDGRWVNIINFHFYIFYAALIPLSYLVDTLLNFLLFTFAPANKKTGNISRQTFPYEYFISTPVSLSVILAELLNGE